MESKNLSILLTDIQGYSAKTSGATRFALNDLIDKHHSLLRPVIDFYRGTVIKTMGDAFLCTFESATDAAVCAIAIQMALQEHNRSQAGATEKLNIRIMISSGDVTLNNNDIFGDAVNLVSRMEKLDEFAQGGIGLSEATYLLMNHQEIVAELVGEREFKGIARPVRIYSIPLGKQKLDQFPGRLTEMRERGKKVKELSSRAGPVGDSPWWKRKSFVVAAILILLLVGGALRKRALQRAVTHAHDIEVVRLFRMSGMPLNGKVLAAEFLGTPDEFRMVDRDGDGVATRQELHTFILDHHIERRRNDEAP